VCEKGFAGRTKIRYGDEENMKAYAKAVPIGLVLWVVALLTVSPVAGSTPETKTEGAEASADGDHHQDGEHHDDHEGHGHSDDPAAAAAAHAPMRVQRILYKVQQQMKLEQNEEAGRTIREFLEKHPDQDHCLLEFCLGNVEYSLNKPAEALERFHEAVKLDPDYGPAWVNLGQVAFEQKRYGLAAEALVKAYEMSGENKTEYLYYAAVAHILNGNAGEAVGLLEPLVNTEGPPPDKEWFQTLLHAYLELDRETDAERLLARMLRFFATDPETWKLWYRFEANRDNYMGAAVAMTIYSYLAPLSREEQILLGDLYVAVDAPLVACEYYEAAMKAGAKPSEYERLASAYIAAHRPADARRVLERALRAEATAKLWTLLGDLLYMEEDYQGAWEAFRESTTLDRQNGRSHLMMGYCALKLGWKEKAVSALKKAADHPRQRKLAGRLLRQAAMP
jgi:tetratricopeptide (TPR) repeat protein